MTDSERALCDALHAAIEQGARLEERVHRLENLVVVLQDRLARLENPSAAAWHFSEPPPGFRPTPIFTRDPVTGWKAI